MSENPTPHTAGAFDIRNVIGGLLGIYGIILLVTGLVSHGAPALTGQLHADLWAGAALVVVSVVFLAWARLRPIVVDRSPADGATPSRERRPG